MTAATARSEMLFDGETDLMIEVHGPVECDDGSEGYEIAVRSCALASGERPRVMRVPVDVWRAFVRAVGRLR